MDRRLNLLQESLINENMGAYLINNPYNLRYITGFTGSSGQALVTQNHAYFITDFRYQEQARKECPEFEVVIAGGQSTVKSPMVFIGQLIRDENILSIGYEEEFVTVAYYDQLVDVVDDQRLIPASGLIEVQREEKDSKEIAHIQKACQIADAAFDHILGFIKPGMTEIEVANELDFYMRKQGASGVSFDTIVASGYRSAMPHGVASGKIIEANDLVTLDFGCYYQGYTSDITRTFAMGPVSQQEQEIYQIVLEANQLVRDEARPGLTGQKLDGLARDFISQHGYGDCFGHSLGHGIGLEIHEGPQISKNNNRELKANSVITDEPGIYLHGQAGVRIEDDLLLTATGNQVLTHAPRELIVLS
ncbi:peptidase M24 [Aerococcus urinaehominis]|uniref:Peptidase M24 n=1 Tax=Aerococcus urinaehominis TaxID=128944 RepID=A0A0X8FK88_9LACT|nr:Xaa-Pro peptidase family protein [Aerococcus urinaehominis]AMB98863.1 peptidase M24 [Aerococcus urinaehominis]SDM16811.1 Xaa-Pro aminopeptidase [Aerococcus urinaehominis]